MFVDVSMCLPYYLDLCMYSLGKITKHMPYMCVCVYIYIKYWLICKLDEKYE
jgi:hypothetical protein